MKKDGRIYISTKMDQRKKNGTGKKSRRGHGCLSLVSIVCCQVEVSASGCGVSECDREASIIRTPWPTTGCCAMKKKKSLLLTEIF
jgi:hypothetical protein